MKSAKKLARKFIGVESINEFHESNQDLKEVRENHTKVFKKLHENSSL